MPTVPRRQYDERPEPSDVFPEMEPIHVKVVKSEYRKSRFPDERTGEDKYEIGVVFEPLDDKYSKVWIFDSPGYTLHPKGKLRPLVQAVHPADLNDDQLHSFDTDDLEGKQLLILGKLNNSTKTGKTYFNVVHYKRLPNGKAAESSTSTEAAKEPTTTGGKNTAIDF